MKDLTKGNETKLIFYYAMPIFLGNILQQGYNIVDSIIVGRAIGKDALGAVGVSAPINFFVLSLILGVTMGSTILVGQYFGAKDKENLRKTIDTSFIFIMVSSIVVALLGCLFSSNILALLGTPKDIFSQALIFLRITFLGIPFSFGYNVVSAILRGAGDSKSPLYFLIFSSAINASLSVIFVIFLKFGVAGSALGTLIAQGCSFVFGYIYTNKKYNTLTIRVRNISFDKEILYKILKIGIPNGVQYLLVSMAQMFLQSLTNSFGTDTMAAFSTAARIDSIGTLPALTFMAAFSGFAAQNLGASEHERVKKGYKSTLIMSIMMTLFITIAVQIFKKGIMGMFVDNGSVINIGMSYLSVVSLFYIFPTIQFVTYGLIRGSGDSIIPMIISVACFWAIRIPIAYYLSNKIGAASIYWSNCASWFIGFICAYVYYLSGRWKNNAIAKKTLVAKA